MTDLRYDPPIRFWPLRMSDFHKSVLDVDLDKYPKWPGFKEGLSVSNPYRDGHNAGLKAGFKNGYEIGTRDGKRKAVQSGKLPGRVGHCPTCGGLLGDDPPGSSDTPKGTDDSPQEATMEWKLNRILATVQERYGVGRVVHTIVMAHEDLQQLLEEMDASWHREAIGWTPDIVWHFTPWSLRVTVDHLAKPGEVKLCFHDNQTSKTTL